MSPVFPTKLHPRISALIIMKMDIFAQMVQLLILQMDKSMEQEIAFIPMVLPMGAAHKFFPLNKHEHTVYIFVYSVSNAERTGSLMLVLSVKSYKIFSRTTG